jgi:hypothetical protein
MVLQGGSRGEVRWRVTACAHDSFYTACEVVMAIPLNTMREFQDKRVKMRFDDDFECVATLHSATQDMDGSLHLIYDKVEWASDPSTLEGLRDKNLYAPGESLVSIEEAS